MTYPAGKYTPTPVIDLAERTWPGKQLTTAPRWCSTDLRDGNQALANPMDQDKKVLLFDHLIRCGFQEIEVAFPSASQTDFDFVRALIKQDKIPDAVWIQVITQSRPDLIERTIASLAGAPRAIVHLYNATAPVFRELVFNKSKAETIALAVAGLKQMRTLCEQQPETDWVLEYSPETFCFTELDFALAVCEAVKAAWQPSAERPMILNLPATVEVNTPNVYADQIESFIRQFSDLSHITISIHPHNDRGTGVASAELAMLAGAQRIEGCLFGNGERTGNVDLVTLAMNLYTQGIDPQLDYSDIRQTVELIEYCNQIPVHPRHPYAGELVFTAFSGSHQDAIKKGFAIKSASSNAPWLIPYLPLDPQDVGCSYEAVIRVNSQSGKSGVAWLIEQNHGLKLPRALQIDFSQRVKLQADISGQEMGLSPIWSLFRRSYGLVPTPDLALLDYRCEPGKTGQQLSAKVAFRGKTVSIRAEGNGLLSALLDGLRQKWGIEVNILDYAEHTLGQKTQSKAVAYVACETADQQRFFGVAIEADSSRASLQAALNAIGNALKGSASAAQLNVDLEQLS
ncbi:2-isopropylmalate synthase [Photobacterium sp. TY1-4]|uniref:2-isopropylmalate synthase n=1 Tax=Photobacterium sp. TY1-4 TaxID=2899122 RepID=UPI0021C00870|nr:2-isopropylmalate synthase [Photobacterium sp. TY1-4]UXI03394.1 2-isopropylmalate synthase [Photobacterium sp. TY1-4]